MMEGMEQDRPVGGQIGSWRNQWIRGEMGGREWQSGWRWVEDGWRDGQRSGSGWTEQDNNDGRLGGLTEVRVHS